MGIGKKQYQHLATLGPPPFRPRARGACRSGTTWGCEEEEDGKEDYCNVSSQSSFAIHLCAHQNRPWSFFSGGLLPA